MTTAALDTKISEVGNEIPNVSGLVKKTDYNSKMSDIEGKYITISDYNKFISDISDAKTKHKELVNKSDISDLNAKLETLATKAELKAEQDKIVKLHILAKKILVLMVLKISLFISQHMIC